jgi:hypothetical protein
MKKTNTIKSVMDRFEIPAKIAAKLFGINQSTVRGLRTDRYTKLTSQKTIDKRAHDLARQYGLYLGEKLEGIEQYLEVVGR